MIAGIALQKLLLRTPADNALCPVSNEALAGIQIGEGETAFLYKTPFEAS